MEIVLSLAKKCKVRMHYTCYILQAQPENQKVCAFQQCSLTPGIVRESGGNAVQLAFTMQFLFNIKPNEVIFCASDIGWVPPPPQTLTIFILFWGLKKNF